MLDLLLLVKKKENLFEVERILTEVIERDEYMDSEKEEIEKRTKELVSQLRQIGENEVADKLLNEK